MTRPFLRLNNQILCFEMSTLFDNFYRVLQRVIFRMGPSYKETWNERQKAVSEELPFTYIGKILSGAHIFRQIYYRYKTDNGSVQWHEADSLLMYEDHLFIAEVKVGAFTYSSPATDISAHIESLRNLVLNPAVQGICVRLLYQCALVRNSIY